MGLEDIILRDGSGNAEAREAVVKHRIKTEFGYSSEQANYELDNHAGDILVHLKIWELTNRRQEIDQQRQEFQQRARGTVR